MDAYKLCKLARKPTPRATRDIGAWYLAFSLTSAVSVMTNCALLAMDKDVQVSEGAQQFKKRGPMRALKCKADCRRIAEGKPSHCLQAFAPAASQRDWILLFVAIEHGFLLLRMAIDRLIPDVSGKIKESMDRDDWMLRKHK